MLNKLEALKVFCVAAETLQFKEAANRLAISPPVVTRIIAELEDHLGEPLFQRNTRQIKLTEFGQQFLPQAKQLVEETERLFAPTRRRHNQDMAGLVRITLPELPDQENILQELLQAISPYPELIIDWQQSEIRVNAIEAQIDLGIRIGNFTDGRMITRKVGEVTEKIVAAPTLLANNGYPKDIADLQKNFPLSAIFDGNTGRVWSWYLNDHWQFTPNRPQFIGSHGNITLQAALAGRVVAHQLDWLVDPYLSSGELVELFAEIPKYRWPVYVYRPQRTITPTRVKVVFDLLVEIVGKRFKAKPHTKKV